MDWRKTLPWAAVLGAIVGVVLRDYFLVVLGVLLFAGAFFWRSPPEGEDE